MNRSIQWTTVVLFLCSVAAAGEPTRLTFDGRIKYTPVFCSDGERIVYVDFERPNLYRLKRLSLSGGEAEDLHPEVASFEFEPAWSRGTDVYAYAHIRGTLSVSVLIRSPGKDPVEILPGGGFDGLRSPAVSPDGSRVLYAHGAKGAQQIHSASTTGPTSRRMEIRSRSARRATATSRST